MSDYQSGDSDDTLSLGYAFDLPQFNLRGLRIFVGHRRRTSIEIDPMGDRMEWMIEDEDDADNGEREGLSFDRGFLGRRHPASQQMGQAIDLALRMMETPKSINIMTRVAKRMVDDRPLEVLHITPQSAAGEVVALVRNWIAKLRQQEFFKIQLIVEKLVYHAFSGHDQSRVEHQICLFHVANLIINQVQAFWVAFLWPEVAHRGTEQPVAVHNEATMGLLDFYRSPSAGYHWDAEFFGGIVQVHHMADSPHADFTPRGGFGRNLSIGYPYLNRADGTEQCIPMGSITRCVNYDFSEVLRGGLGTCGNRVPPFGFPFLDYPREG
ncbi:hypothetical protein UCDDA912_g06083 [Diaporthe ampelina]|uniref:Uncharacterized protein n=1 Tax=Diaporthe ampelina TaxID=1214573 RepID=A0A0G2I1H6_9PEZI|nr:hypothetical protein UCDDA912_g06083 [Diaporthe ampelina]